MIRWRRPVGRCAASAVILTVLLGFGRNVLPEFPSALTRLGRILESSIAMLSPRVRLIHAVLTLSPP